MRRSGRDSWAPIFGLLLAVTSAHAATATDIRRCNACRATCDDTAQRGDDACCRDARGVPTKDFCVSRQPADYATCAKDLARTRQACRAACDQAACAR